MYESILFKISDHIGRDDRAGALTVLRSAIHDGAISPHDGIELMLAVRRGSSEAVLEAISFIRQGAAGAYRFVPPADYAFA